MENMSCLIPKNEMDLQLDFVFTSVYIGKIKGASKGCVTVSIYIFSLVLLLGQAQFSYCLFSANENRIDISLYRAF